MNTNIAGMGGSATHRLRERAGLVIHSAGVGGCGFKKTVSCMALLCSNFDLDKPADQCVKLLIDQKKLFKRPSLHMKHKDFPVSFLHPFRPKVLVAVGRIPQYCPPDSSPAGIWDCHNQTKSQSLQSHHNSHPLQTPQTDQFQGLCFL